MLPIVWSTAAREDLLTVVSFIAQHNPAAAQRLGLAVQDSTRYLAEHPYLYRAGRVPGTREIVVHPNYIVVYRVELDCIQILRLLHARQMYP